MIEGRYGGGRLIVAKTAPYGGVATTDGRMWVLPNAGWCLHSARTVGNFEYLGLSNPGVHGIYDMTESCRGVIDQWGPPGKVMSRPSGLGFSS